jgi:DNA-binding GntR family transcriptional regulator
MFVGEASRGYSRPPTSQEAVLREIRRAIMARELKPGERVRQEKLAGRLNVSRVPVREALKVLEAEGQVTYQPHRGYTVVALSSEELEEIYLIRRLLETEATRRAVPRVDAELIERLEALMGQMEELAEAGDVLRYAEANRDFHFVLFERAGLPRLYHMIEVLWRISEAYRGAIFDYTWSKRAQKYHRAIIVACKAGDVAGTIAAQDEHRSDAIASITAFLKGPDHDRKGDRGEE